MVVMPETQKIKKIVQDLKSGGFDFVFVGGFALILLGSERTTFDTDFVIKRLDGLEQAKELIKIMSDNGFYYASKLNADGIPKTYIENVNVAASRIMIDQPDSIFFWDPKLEMKIDILQDFPIKLSELMKNALKKKIDRQIYIEIASLKDMKKMKEMALKDRKSAKDLQDLEFIKKKLTVSKKSKKQ